MHNTSSPKFDKVLNTKNSLCPIPVLLTRESISEMKMDQILKIITKDPTAEKDIIIWAKKTGNTLIDIEKNKNEIIIYIKKGIPTETISINDDIHLSTKKVKHLRLFLNEDKPHNIESSVALEAPVHLTVNNKSVMTIIATPTNLEDLAIGYLIDENIIDNVQQITNIKTKGTNVFVKTKDDITDRLKASETNQIISSECVSLEHYLRLRESRNIPIINSDYHVNISELSQMIREFNSRHNDEKHPGGIHSASLFEKGKMKYYLMDISRHSAVDKVFGAGVKDGIDFSQSIILTSGRQPAGMVLKAAQMNIPISVSMRGPIYSGILSAKKTEITLICYASINRLDIHSRPDRILSK